MWSKPPISRSSNSRHGTPPFTHGSGALGENPPGLIHTWGLK